MNLILSVIISLAFVLLSASILVSATSLKNIKNEFLKFSGIFLGGAVIVFLILGLYLNFAVDCEKKPSVISVFLLTVIPYFSFTALKFSEKQTIKKFAVRFAAVTIAAFVAEAFIFNFKSICFDNEKFMANYSSAQTETPDTVSISDSGIVISGDGQVVLNCYEKDIRAVKMDFEGKDNKVLCRAEMRDGNLSSSFVSVGEKYFSADGGTAEFTFNTFEKLYEIKLIFSNVTGEVELSSCMLSTSLPFRFSDVRFALILSFLTAIVAISTFNLYKISYNSKSRKHKIAVGIVALACSLSMLSLYQPEQEMIDYETVDIASADPFVQMFDAVQKGQVNIEIEPSEALLAMENPYDTSVRSAMGISYAWDRAFYDGEYYSYYGIAPVFVLYYPVYFITGKLPTLNMTNVFFGVFANILLCAAILSFVKRFIKKPNLLLLLMTMGAGCFASGSFALTSNSSLYSVPGLAGSCFLYLCLWMGFEACTGEKNIKKYIMFALSGIAFCLCVASRPTRALSALLLAPVFLGVLFGKEINVKEKALSVASFLVPVAVGMGAIMLYNNARFDSPFEFGAVYQLTLSNIKASGITLSALPFAIIQYFFQPLQMSGIFPFFNLPGVTLSGYGQYVYSDFAHGAFMYPIVFAGFAILPFYLYHYRKKKGTKLQYNDECIKKYTFAAAAVLGVVLAWLDFCMAGVIFSYVCDILPVLVLLAVWLILDTHNKLEAVPSASGKSIWIFSTISIATVAVGILELIALFNAGIYNAPNPDIFYALEDLVCFWN